MNKIDKRVLVLGSFLFATLAFSAYSWASAYRGEANQPGPNYSEERHALMEKAFETNNYDLWKSQVGNQGVTRFVNKDNFAKFAQAHRLAEAGRYDEADKIRADLGLGKGNGGCKGSCGNESCGNNSGGCRMHQNN